MKRLLLLLAVAAVVSGCGTFDANAATVNGRGISDDILVDYVSVIEKHTENDPALSGPNRTISSKQIAGNVLTELIVSEATQAEFKRRKLTTTVDQQNRAKAAILEIYGPSLGSLPPEFRDKMTRRLAQADALRLSGLKTADYRCLRVLAFSTEAQAKASRAGITTPAQFLALAKQQGEATGSGEGHFGCFTAADFAQLEPTTRSNLESLTIGRISQPVFTGQNWVLLYSAAEFSEPLLKPRVTVNPRYGRFVARAADRRISGVYNMVGYVDPPKVPETSTTTTATDPLPVQPGAPTAAQ